MCVPLAKIFWHIRFKTLVFSSINFQSVLIAVAGSHSSFHVLPYGSLGWGCQFGSVMPASKGHFAPFMNILAEIVGAEWLFSAQSA
jgi:hypothetical protein